MIFHILNFKSSYKFAKFQRFRISVSKCEDFETNFPKPQQMHKLGK